MRTAEAFLERFVAWASARAEIEAVVLVGSWARGDARPDSDVDLVIVAEAPERYERDLDWVHRFGEPASVALEDWGLVQSVRVHYRNGLEVEFGWTTDAWVNTDPVDPGTAAVIRNGARVLLDRAGRLSKLVASVRASAW